jgi:formylglycine-generating enzyme required for sulfatase activity
MSDIFISYASEDRARAKVLAGVLEDQGWSVWWDRTIPAGRTFDEVIEEALDTAKSVIVLWSEKSVKSRWVRTEAQEGADRNILIPVLIEKVRIPLAFRRIQAANLIGWDGSYTESSFQELVGDIAALLGPPPKAEEKRQQAEAETKRKDVGTSKQIEVIPTSEPTPDALDYPKSKGLETEKAGSKSLMAKVLAAICIVTLITIISIGVFLKDRQRTDQPKRKPGNVETNSIGMKLVYIPAGSFMMGSSRSAAQLAREYDTTKEEYFTDEFPQHQVRISEGFWMGQTEVTQGQYKSVMNAQPWSGQDNVQEDANNPAVLVTWDDAAAFCTKLSQQEGKTYRLPTEAEWEYACRAGTTTRFSFGDSGSSLGDYAWCRSYTYEADQKYAHSVGQKKLNPWGLYDMHGNVWEWCSDWNDEDYYSYSPSVDPKGPPTGTSRSLRGGSWNAYELNLRCSVRLYLNPDYRVVTIGFRVVRSQS